MGACNWGFFIIIIIHFLILWFVGAYIYTYTKLARSSTQTILICPLQEQRARIKNNMIIIANNRFFFPSFLSTFFSFSFSFFSWLFCFYFPLSVNYNLLSSLGGTSILHYFIYFLIYMYIQTCIFCTYSEVFWWDPFILSFLFLSCLFLKNQGFVPFLLPGSLQVNIPAPFTWKIFKQGWPLF